MKSAIGILVSRLDIKIIELEKTSTNIINCQSDLSVKLQDGDRSKAYLNIKEFIRTYLMERKPELVVVKGSAVSGKRGATLGLLEAAELRGVIMTAAEEANCNVKVVKKGSVSRTFGSRKVDEYVKDEEFWGDNFIGELRKGSREIALLTYYAMND